MNRGKHRAIVKFWSGVWGFALTAQRCWICGLESEELHRAHLQARRDKGPATAENLVLTCTFCNDVVDECVSEAGMDAATAWVKRCATDGWAPPPAAFSLSSKLWERAPKGMSAFDAIHVMELAYKAFAQLRHMKWEGKTKAALAAKKARGERTGGIPLGRGVDAAGRLVEGDAAEVKTLTLIQKLRADGMSIRAIAAELNARGVKARGERWHATTVARVLKLTA